jgi:hypothetical protein
MGLFYLFLNRKYRDAVSILFKTALYRRINSIPDWDKKFSVHQSIQTDSVALRTRPQFSGYMRGLALELGWGVVKQPGF